MKRAIVLVLGDLGRSPRMLNHARCFAAHGWHVDLIGYAGSALPVGIRESACIEVHAIAETGPPTTARATSRLRYLAGAGTRAIRLGWWLTRVLVRKVKRPDLILVQNPPGIPTLPLAWLAARLRSAGLVIDWHNLTSAMLALRLGTSHPLVALAAVVERGIGRRADSNLFVSQAMAVNLRDRWGLTGVVFRDRPGNAFRALDLASRAAIRAGILARVGCQGDESEWLILVSPTSWTADEDFDLLLEAAQRVDALLGQPTAASSQARRILVVVSGRGALRERFERRLAALRAGAVTVRTLWMEPDEYPSLVAAADAGLCLHRSASGLDLPMKVMDFFGCSVPVCALDYGPCLAEAVRNDENGLTFTNADQLARLLVEMTHPGRLHQLRAGAAASGAVSWDRAWEEEVLPAL